MRSRGAAVDVGFDAAMQLVRAGRQPEAFNLEGILDRRKTDQVDIKAQRRFHLSGRDAQLHVMQANHHPHQRKCGPAVCNRYRGRPRPNGADQAAATPSAPSAQARVPAARYEPSAQSSKTQDQKDLEAAIRTVRSLPPPGSRPSYDERDYVAEEPVYRERTLPRQRWIIEQR